MQTNSLRPPLSNNIHIQLSFDTLHWHLLCLQANFSIPKYELLDITWHSTQQYIYINNICRSSLLYSLLKLSSYIGSVIVYLVWRTKKKGMISWAVCSKYSNNRYTATTQQQNQPTKMKLPSSRATNNNPRNRVWTSRDSRVFNVNTPAIQQPQAAQTGNQQ